ncbi:MAG: signal peptidase I [Chloroflexi bacterium]|nr:signal peptidase I [Chloroflexota bacterium]
MMTQRRWYSILSAILLFLFLVVAWLSLAPLEVGGSAAYVIVNGNSMEPLYHASDLVVVRSADVYQVGDIVTYRHPDVGRVIHRIIAQEEDGFVLQGDNNSWIDSYRPTADDIIGKAWLHIPKLGDLLAQLRTPMAMAVLAGMLPLVTLGGTAGMRRARRRGHTNLKEQRGSMNLSDQSKELALGTFGILLLASVLLAIFAFTRPLTRTVADDIAYEQSGVFSYSAAAPAGVSSTGSIKTGDPIFRQVTNLVNVAFDYQFTTPAPAVLSGTYLLNAQISDPSGWNQTLTLRPETRFAGSAFTASGALDLSQAQAIIDRFEKQTGVQRSQYTLAISPEVRIAGTLRDEDVSDTFSPHLTFRMDKLQLTVANDGQNKTDPFKPSAKSVLKNTRAAPNTLSLLGLNLDVALARWLSIFGIVVGAGGLTVVILLVVRLTQRDEATAIRLKYGSQIVAVRHAELDERSRIVDLASMDDLAKIAMKDGRMILHANRDTNEEYLVPDADVTYRYVLASTRLPARTTEGPKIQIIPSADTPMQEWLRKLEQSQKENAAHCHRVAKLTMRLARQMGWDQREIALLGWGALLHDLGMLNIPDEILRKNGPLTDTEWAVMRQHPSNAYKLLMPVSSQRIVEIPYCHHEKWDGSGYPRGLRGQAIPRAARLFSVVDSWDALCSHRPYRPAWPKERVVAYLRSLAGSHYDPKIVNAFLSLGLE